MAEPARLGKFVLLNKIAVGGMAEIFRARAFGASGFEKDLVIKRILPHLSENADFVKMLIDEAKITVALAHPNIAQIYDLGRADNTYFIAMEYVHGRDLGRIMRACVETGIALPREHILHISTQICNGLDYAHARKDRRGQPLNIIHRDVSPQNVLISYDGAVKLVDFGIAKASNKIGVTRMGEIKGKFAYMSPEQARGEELDRRSDIFAAGILLYEMLAGQRAFFRGSEIQTLRAVQECRFRRFEDLGIKVDDDLKAIVYRALTGDRELRYQDAGGMAADLTRYLHTHAPGYTPHRLAEFMSILFAEDLAAPEERSVGEVGAAIDDAIAEADSDIHTDETVLATPYSKRVTQAEMLPQSEVSHVDAPHRRSGLVLGLGVAGALIAAAIVAAVLLLGSPETGGLRVDSTPAGAALILDGMERAQRTPALLEGLTPGAHELELVYADGRRWQGEAVIRVGALTRVTAPELPPLPGRLEVATRPKGAQVLVDGVVRGVAPLEIDELVPGAHTVEARVPNQPPQKKKLRVEPGKLAEVSFEFVTQKPARKPARKPVRAFGFANINASPWAKIYIDGRYSGEDTPVGRMRIAAGVHTIRLVNPDTGLKKTLKVTVHKGKTITIAEKLE